jgi:hypothetical protein
MTFGLPSPKKNLALNVMLHVTLISVDMSIVKVGLLTC